MNELVHASLPMSVQAKHSLVCHWFGVKETTWRVCALSAWRVLGVLGEGVHGGVCLEGVLGGVCMEVCAWRCVLGG